MWTSTKQSFNRYIWILFIWLVVEVTRAAGTVITPKVTVSNGTALTRLPCWCYDNLQSEVVYFVTWKKTRHDPDDDTLLKVYNPGNVTSPKTVAGKYTLGQELSLLIKSPQIGDSGEYICHVTFIANTTISSVVELDISDSGDRSTFSQIHHYIIPAVIIIILLVEICFIFALWVNLRQPRTRNSASYTGFFSSSRDIHKDWFVQNPVPSTPPWETENKEGKHILLADKLNDGPYFDKDSGFDDKVSVHTASCRESAEIDNVV